MLGPNHKRILRATFDAVRAIEVDANRIKRRCVDTRNVLDGLDQIFEFATAACATSRVANETRIITGEITTMMRHLNELVTALNDLTQVGEAVESKSVLKRLAIQKGK